MESIPCMLVSKAARCFAKRDAWSRPHCWEIDAELRTAYPHLASYANGFTALEHYGRVFKFNYSYIVSSKASDLPPLSSDLPS